MEIVILHLWNVLETGFVFGRFTPTCTTISQRRDRAKTVLTEVWNINKCKYHQVFQVSVRDVLWGVCVLLYIWELWGQLRPVPSSTCHQRDVLWVGEKSLWICHTNLGWGAVILNQALIYWSELHSIQNKWLLWF